MPRFPHRKVHSWSQPPSFCKVAGKSVTLPERCLKPVTPFAAEQIKNTLPRLHMKPVELTQSWQLLPAVCPSSHGFRNFRTSILTKTLYPVIKSIRADVVLYTLLVVCKSTDTAFHNQPELFISGNACCSHNLTSIIEVKCLHLVFPVNLSRVKCLHFLLVLWS